MSLSSPTALHPPSPSRWKRKNKMIQKNDPIMKDAKATDIIIPVMGPTGAGKSTFINKLLGRDGVAVGHDLESCTAQLQPIIITAEDRSDLVEHGMGRLVIVDTPGFDDTYVDDSEILRRISTWLAASYSDSMQLGGVIFMHEISQVRMSGTMRTNADVFRKLCGQDRMHSVILVTTKWSEVAVAQGQKRERELAEKYWKDMLDNGAEQTRFLLGDEKSASTIVHRIIERRHQNNDHDPLYIQHELVDLQKIIPDTEAAKSLRITLEEALEKQRQLAAKMRSKNPNEAGYKDAQEQIRKILQQLGQLKVSLPRRFLAALGGT